MRHLGHTEADLDAAWDRLAGDPINAGILQPHTALHDGEVWQFMGFWEDETDGTVHAQFRHRCHPDRGQRAYRDYVIHRPIDDN